MLQSAQVVPLVLALAALPSLAAQSPRADSARSLDSARVLARAKEAQTSFELFRRSQLPRGDSHGGPCDAVIGRYCYWRDDGERDERPRPSELPLVESRRRELTRVLDSAARILPGDAWIVGQRVHYLIESGRSDDARRAASACAAPASWCALLAGYVSHAAHDYARADSAYGAALSAMTDAERCAWLDLSLLLDDELEARFKRLACTERAAFARRLFFLASPLYLAGGRDVRTEYFTRLTRARIAEGATPVDGNTWGNDARELVVRYGWPLWYSRTDVNPGSQGPASIIAHDGAQPYYFLPRAAVLDDLSAARTSDWDLDAHGARTEYAPPYTRTVHDLPHQFARFRRGDSTLVVAAWRTAADTTLFHRALDAALVLVSDTAQRAIARTVARDSGVLTLAVPAAAASGVLSLEVLAREERRAARVRLGLRPLAGTGVVLSDLLLVASRDSATNVFETARAAALASDAVRANRPLGVYWETYGLASTGEPVDYALSVEQVGTSWLRRTAERLHLADRTSGLRIQWQEVARPAGGIAARGVRVDLSRLRHGQYRVRLTVAARDGGRPPATSERVIEVR